MANAVTQRKTAVLSRNKCPQKTSVHVTKALVKAHVQGGHRNVRVQGQNLDRSGPVPHRSESDDKPEGPKVDGGRQSLRADERSARMAENSFEVWLKERGENWERDRRREYVELGEFELLERAADEFSFSSNSSFVDRLLRRDGRRLSSTPVKSPPKSSFPVRNVEDRTGLGEAHGPPESPVDLATEGLNARPDEATSDRSGDEGAEESDSSTCSETVFYRPAAAPNPREPFGFQVSPPPYDKRSYQDREAAGSPEAEEENHGDSTPAGARGRVEFDDDDTWNEPESPAKQYDRPGGVPKRNTAISKGADPDRRSEGPSDRKPEPPPKPCPPPSEPPDSDECSERGAGDENSLLSIF